MPYDEIAKKATMKYLKTKQKRLVIFYKKDDYEQFVKPAIDKSGLPTTTFIKKAVAEKIEKDGLLNDTTGEEQSTTQDEST